MAIDPKEVQQQIDKFNDELDKVQDKLSDLSKTLGESLKNKFAESIVNVRKLTNSLKDTKSISKELLKVQQDNEVLILKEKIAKDNLTKALTKQAELSKKASSSQKLAAQKAIDEYTAKLNNTKAQLILNQALEDTLRKAELISEQEKKQNTLSGFIKDKYKEIGKSFESFFSVASIFKVILDGALRFSKTSTDIGKNLGYGADNANRVANNMADAANTSFNVNNTLKNQLEAFNEISTATGYIGEYSADTLETQIMLTKQFGLQADEAAGIYRFSVLTGKASSEVNKQMVGAFAATRNSLRAGIPFKATMAEAAKVSGQLAANLQNNPEQIVKAVTQVKALGLSLEQSAKAGESLLNFETSLENELKAELLTGKQLNLERARAAALQGDQVTVAQELVKNVGTLEDFQRMNVLQQKALAEAVGLTTDEVANQLRNQQIAIREGKSLAQVTAEELEKAQQRQDVQTKFNAAVEKLQDFIGNLLAGPLGGFLETLTKSLDVITSIATVFGTIWVAQKAITALESLKLGFGVAAAAAKTEELTAQTALNIAKGEELATQIGIAAAWAVANPFKALAGLAIAAAAVAGVYALINKGPKFAKGGIVTGEINNATIGEAGPEAIIPLNSPKADNMLGGAQIDLTPMINAINEVRTAVNNLANRPVVVNMDTKQVGTSLVQSTYKLA